jgi:RNA polymerase sigma-70 factor (ECF subfamily)
MVGLSDGELLASGIAADFGVFYERHVAVLTAYVGRRVAGADIAFDVVAETFARALEHRGSYDDTRGPAIAWLIGIARNLIADAHRRGQVADAARGRLGITRIALDDEQLVLVEERGQADLRSLLGELSGDEQEAVFRYVLVDESYPVIAARVGTSEQVVRKRVSRGLARLRRIVEGEKS